MVLAQTPRLAKLVGRDPETIVLGGAVSSSVLDRDVDLGCLGVQRVLDEAEDGVIQGRDDDGRLDLPDHIVWQTPNRHGKRGVGGSWREQYPVMRAIRYMEPLGSEGMGR